MSLLSGGYYVKVAEIDGKLETLDLSAGSIITKLEDLSGVVNQISSIIPTHGYLIDSIEMTTLNSYSDFTTLDLSAGTYSMVVYPNFNLISTDNTLLWNSTTCNTNQFTIKLWGVDHQDPADPQDFDCIATIPIGMGVDDRTTSVSTNKRLGSMSFIFSLPADQSVLVSTKFSSLTQTRASVDISPLSIDTALTFSWIKL